MIKVHHLNNSRSQRILWLLEELGVPYEIEHYKRNEMNRAPDSLKAVHPLGKSPVITDGKRVLAESGAIIDYIIRRYGGGKLVPPAGSDAYEDYAEMMHYAEGSAVVPVLFDLFLGFLPEKTFLNVLVADEIAKQLAYLDGKLGDHPFLVGNDLTGADVQVGFVLEFARGRGHLSNYPRLIAYVDRLQARPAYRRALERGGPYELAGFGSAS
jgi:glutathione S-transferase